MSISSPSSQIKSADDDKNQIIVKTFYAISVIMLQAFKIIV